MNLNYSHIYSNKKYDISTKKMLYKENTNVFAYYVLKMILLFYYEDFFYWCDKNNINLFTFKKDKKNLDNFFKFIKLKYKGKHLLSNINLIYKKYDSIVKDEKISNTLRMTVFD